MQPKFDERHFHVRSRSKAGPLSVGADRGLAGAQVELPASVVASSWFVTSAGPTFSPRHSKHHD